MISRAEGRKPDDNITAVTIQYLDPETIKLAKSRTVKAQRMRQLRTGLIALGGVVAIAVIAVLFVNLSKTSARMNKLANQPTATAIYITSTPQPTLRPIAIGEAIADIVSGAGANVAKDQNIPSGSSVTSGDGLIRIRVGETTGRDGFIYLFPNSSALINFGEQMIPQLNSGAIYIQPSIPIATVDLGTFENGLIATVSGSRMIVQVDGNDVWIFCFEGKCLLEPKDKDPMRIPEGSKMVYHLSTSSSDNSEKMTYDEGRKWNQECEYLCLTDFLPTPTPITIMKTPTPTFLPTFNDDPNCKSNEVLVDHRCVPDPTWKFMSF